MSDVSPENQPPQNGNGTEPKPTIAAKFEGVGSIVCRIEWTPEMLPAQLMVVADILRLEADNMYRAGKILAAQQAQAVASKLALPANVKHFPPPKAGV